MRSFWLVALTLVALAGPLSAADRPNVLFLLSDDQRVDAIGALRNDSIETPHLDRLVEQGTVFTNAYCMGSQHPAVCYPSRAMLLSGQTLFRVPLDLRDIPILPTTFAEAGYETFGTGKWHNGPAAFARGFQDGGAIFFGGMSDHDRVPIHDFDPAGRYAQKTRRVAERFSSELFAEEAIRFLRERKQNRPFFAYVAFTAPHDPRTPPEEYRARYDAERLPLPTNFLPAHPFDNGELQVRDEQLAPWPRTPEVIREHLADYYGMVTHMDAQIGRILAALEETGQADNTLIVFTSDHGLAIGSHGLLGKQNLYEHSMRAPLVLAGPGIGRGERREAFCYLLDIFPTLCELAGLSIPGTVEGRSLAPVIRGEREAVRESVFCAYRDVQRSIRQGQWKLIHYPKIGKTQLFDLQADPHETRDLSDSAEQAGRIEQLLAALAAEQRKLGDETRLGNGEQARSHATGE